MAYNIKYTMSFKDRLGAAFTMTFGFVDYVGDVTTLVLGETPAKLTFNGDEDNIFDTIHTSQVEITIFQEVFNQQLYDDINTLTDKSCQVIIQSDTGFVWAGYMIPDFSKKTFSNLTTIQTIQAVDLFSYLKGVPAVDADGKILYGKYSLISLLENAFLKGLSGGFYYDLISNMTITNAPTELDGHNILEQLSITAESLNDSDGRPPMCYDVIQKILHGLGLTCSLQGERVIITDIVSEDLNIYKEIGIIQDAPAEILIDNSEVITKTRPAKELSAEFKYNRSTGILPDGFFSDWDGLALNQWAYNEQGYKFKVGNGRYENPFGVKLRTHSYEITGTDFNQAAALRNTPYSTVLDGSSYKINFNVKYYDWRAWSLAGLPTPRLQFGALLMGASGKRYTLWQENGYSADQSLWVEMPKDGGGVYERDIDTFMDTSGTSYGQLYTRRLIDLDSTAAIQKLSYDIPSIPEDGTLYIYITSAYINSQKASLITHEDRSDLIYYSVILSENLNVNANGVGGEKHYLTNFGDYSLVEDTETFELETGLNESVAGSIYNAIDFTIPIPYINANHYPIGTQINWMNFRSVGIGLDYDLSLVALVLQNRMYFKRYSNSQIDLTFRSNTVKFTDLIKLMNGDVELMPGVFKQLKLDYDLKACEQSVTIRQLQGQRRPFIQDAAATTTQDRYEFYYETN